MTLSDQDAIAGDLEVVLADLRDYRRDPNPRRLVEAMERLAHVVAVVAGLSSDGESIWTEDQDARRHHDH
jgi:hypothetical protein